MLHFILILLGQNHRKILNIRWIFHQKFKQILQCVLISLCFSPAVASSFDDIEHPCRFKALIRNLFMDFLVLETVHLHEIQKDLDEL